MVFPNKSYTLIRATLGFEFFDLIRATPKKELRLGVFRVNRIENNKSYVALIWMFTPWGPQAPLGAPPGTPGNPSGTPRGTPGDPPGTYGYAGFGSAQQEGHDGSVQEEVKTGQNRFFWSQLRKSAPQLGMHYARSGQ